jgi:drug/metabolite transporter (DMT)-like permease
MAMPAPEVRLPVVVTRGDSQRLAWVLWILISILGAVLGAIAAWQLRSLVQRGPATLGQDLAYVATVASALLASGCQWLLFRRYKLDVAWWVPAAVVGNLLNAMVVVPSVLRLFVGVAQVGPTAIQTAIVAGAVALGVAGLVVGAAQALVLRGSVGNFAWAWIPATAIGGALSGAITTALSAQLFGLTAFATISLVAAVGALLTAACQAPVFLRLIR